MGHYIEPEYGMPLPREEVDKAIKTFVGAIEIAGESDYGVTNKLDAWAEDVRESIKTYLEGSKLTDEWRFYVVEGSRWGEKANAAGEFNAITETTITAFRRMYELEMK